MTIARSRQISLQDTPYYHVVSRCVRRAFLCGADVHSSQSYEHRRQWVVDKPGQLLERWVSKKERKEDKKRRSSTVSGSLDAKPDENG